jgi:tRNA pseudouridine32 synthase/23S rRNA pseudouridine746 synthase/23S rRNA pseudouridine1911/1915/1917 synthase
MAKKRSVRQKKLARGLELIYEDRDILVVNKPAGLLTERTGSDKTRTAYFILTDYVRKGYSKSRARVFTVHRLDQWTSGVMIFAKSEPIQQQLKDQWKDTEKKYVAVVHGQLAKKNGIIRSYLAEKKDYTVYSTKDTEKGKLAETAYKVVKETGPFSLLEIQLLTGRKNQIRVHMADQGHPVVGDRKYGQDGVKYPRLALHSQSISFKHPGSGEAMTFETDIPYYIHTLLKVKKANTKDQE